MLTEPKVCQKSIDDYDAKGNKIGSHTCGATAKSARDDFAIDDIMNQCDKLKDYSNDVRSIQKQVTACTDLIGKEQLSINGTGVENLVNNFTDTTNVQAQNISDLADKTKQDAINAFNAKQAAYNASLPCGHN